MTRRSFHARRFTAARAFSLLLALLPAQAVPSHRHEEDEVILHCLSGGAEFTFGGEKVTLTAGEMLFADGANDFAPADRGDHPCALLVTLVRK